MIKKIIARSVNGAPYSLDLANKPDREILFYLSDYLIYCLPPDLLTNLMFNKLTEKEKSFVFYNIWHLCIQVNSFVEYQLRIHFPGKVTGADDVFEMLDLMLNKYMMRMSLYIALCVLMSLGSILELLDQKKILLGKCNAEHSEYYKYLMALSAVLNSGFLCGINKVKQLEVGVTYRKITDFSCANILLDVLKEEAKSSHSIHRKKEEAKRVCDYFLLWIAIKLFNRLSGNRIIISEYSDYSLQKTHDDLLDVLLYFSQQFIQGTRDGNAFVFIRAHRNRASRFFRGRNGETSTYKAIKTKLEYWIAILTQPRFFSGDYYKFFIKNPRLIRNKKTVTPLRDYLALPSKFIPK